MAHGEYLNAGLAYQFHPHRDTWFSAPHQQLNWWLPVYAIESENWMAFHPHYFDRPIRNSSAGYDYEEWNRSGRRRPPSRSRRRRASSREPTEPLELEPDVRVVTPPGGLIVFSAAQLHSTVPNTTGRTRFSIDFRTVNLDDLVEGVARRTSTRSAPGRRSGTTCAPPTSSRCRRTWSRPTGRPTGPRGPRPCRSRPADDPGAVSTTAVTTCREVLDLRPGELVRVRPAAEIFATLDEDGALEGLPFMPEMVLYCDRTFPVAQRADKTCAGDGVVRRMFNTVQLGNVRCDGAAHGGCQAACLMYWKEAWLERAADAGDSASAELVAEEESFVAETLQPATRAAADPRCTAARRRRSPAPPASPCGCGTSTSTRGTCTTGTCGRSSAAC